MNGFKKIVGFNKLGVILRNAVFLHVLKILSGVNDSTMWVTNMRPKVRSIDENI